MTSGSTKTGKTAAARNMEEWWLFVSGLGIGSGSMTSVTAVKVDDGSRWLVG